MIEVVCEVKLAKMRSLKTLYKKVQSIFMYDGGVRSKAPWRVTMEAMSCGTVCCY